MYLFIIYDPFTYLFFGIFTAVCLILYNWFITCILLYLDNVHALVGD